LRKVQHLPKMMFHKQHQATDSWEGTLLTEYPLLARRHILRECVKFVLKSLRVLPEKEKQKRLCGGVLIVKCHSACQSASNYITLSKTLCKYRICVLHRFLFLKISIVFSMKFSYNSSGKNVFIFIFKLKYDSLCIRIW